jgi:hypothetical protein
MGVGREGSAQRGDLKAGRAINGNIASTSHPACFRFQDFHEFEVSPREFKLTWYGDGALGFFSLEGPALALGLPFGFSMVTWACGFEGF